MNLVSPDSDTVTTSPDSPNSSSVTATNMSNEPSTPIINQPLPLPNLSNATESTPTKYRIPTIEITTPNTADLEAMMSAARRDAQEIKLKAKEKIKQILEMEENKEEEKSVKNTKEIDLESKVVQLGLRLQRLNEKLGKNEASEEADAEEGNAEKA